MWPVVVSIAVGVTALAGAAAAVRKWSGGLRRVWRRIGGFLDDWNGEEERPGRLAVPPFPERMSSLEQFARHEIAPRLQLLQLTADQNRDQGTDNAAAIARLDDGQARLDRRVTDHQQRNERQIQLLHEAVDGMRRRQTPPQENP